MFSCFGHKREFIKTKFSVKRFFERIDNGETLNELERHAYVLAKLSRKDCTKIGLIWDESPSPDGTDLRFRGSKTYKNMITDIVREIYEIVDEDYDGELSSQSLILNRDMSPLIGVYSENRDDYKIIYLYYGPGSSIINHFSSSETGYGSSSSYSYSYGSSSSSGYSFGTV